jgi:hypothetical protein
MQRHRPLAISLPWYIIRSGYRPIRRGMVNGSRVDYMPDGLLECATVLIHGTIPRLGPFRFFAQQGWIEEGSLFRSGLTAAVNAIFIPYKWSGANSHSDRLRAAKDLATSLRQSLNVRQFLPHYIVAHSHRGNVALYALNLLTPPERRRIAGIVTLGTPFIRSAAQEIIIVRDNLMYLLKWGTIAWSLGVVGLGYAWISSKGTAPIDQGSLGGSMLELVGRNNVLILLFVALSVIDLCINNAIV